MRCVLLWLCAAAALAPGADMKQTTFEQRPAVALSNDKLELIILTEGGAFAGLTLRDDAEKLSPLWNPARMSRELGKPRAASGGTGHFLCVDGFGATSKEERTAGLQGHGEAHRVPWEIVKTDQNDGIAVTFRAQLPIVQETLTRTVRMLPGENVVYVESQLESLLGFDRPVNWAEHASIGSPFLEPGVTVVDLSGTRSKTRPYDVHRDLPHRLPPGEEFTWPIAPGLDGKGVNLRAAPANPNTGDHTATLVDTTRKLGWATAVHPGKRLVLGYVWRRDEYPWIQNWENYPPTGKLARGIEFATQPFDVPRREAVTANSMFDTPLYRWLPAKSKIGTRFLFFYTRVPEGFRGVTELRFENGSITLEDRVSGKTVTIPASQPL